MESTSRLQRWFGTGPRSDHADGHGLRPPVVAETDLDAIRDAMRFAVSPCSEEIRLRMEAKVKHAASAVELWLIRADIFQCLACQVGQKQAAQRIAGFDPLFSAALPGMAAMRETAGHRRDVARLS